MEVKYVWDPSGPDGVPIGYVVDARRRRVANVLLPVLLAATSLPLLVDIPGDGIWVIACGIAAIATVGYGSGGLSGHYELDSNGNPVTPLGSARPAGVKGRPRRNIQHATSKRNERQ